MDDEEKQILDEITAQVKNSIDEIFDKHGIDSSFIDFKLVCTLLSNNFKPMERLVLLNTEDQTFCDFCGAKTNFYDRREHLHMCAPCYGKFQKNKEGKYCPVV